ncbi:sodium-dependent phosphate transport protein 2B-like [Tigriopus californicus]|uniref:sodium-dependent phosphate transport protein 2B-like n=1 Tax=Tigriopus californicus TaxID=6832 RepID=UPI0027D9F232|nr:sodium-dependent phosphate transport protein 2B-like [Tigriopus californicus]
MAQSDTSSENSEKGSKALRVAFTVLKILAILGLLYLFICSLDLMSVSFRLIVGKATGLLANVEAFNNPMICLMIGIIGTVAVQSSSTFTSIIISLSASAGLDVSQAVPMVMGANIGTSVTNTIVSLTQVADRNEFRRSFAAATVHDMFNWCAVIVLLSLEVICHPLQLVAEGVAHGIVPSNATEIKILKYITEPFTDLIVQIDSDVLNDWSTNIENNATTLLEDCDAKDCFYLFELFASLPDWALGLILVIASLIILVGSLMIMVKILNSLLQGAIAVVIKKVLNPRFESKVLNYLYGYLNIVVGACLTFVVQSSSVFTSTLTPLVGIGLLEIETCYPLFLGSNIGTTSTGMLAALATSVNFDKAITVAFVHLFFNLMAIVLFYPIPFTRIPIDLCKILGNTTAKYRWFAFVYLVGMFILLPIYVVLISLNNIVFIIMFTISILILVFVIVVNVLQRKSWAKKSLSKVRLDTWDFLPKWMHSLGYWDRIFSKIDACSKYRDKDVKSERSKNSTFEDIDLENGETNEGFEKDQNEGQKAS